MNRAVFQPNVLGRTILVHDAAGMVGGIPAQLATLRDAYRGCAAEERNRAIVFSMDPVDYPHQKVHGVDVREADATRDALIRSPVPPVHEVLPPSFGHRHPDDHDDRGTR